MGKRTSLYEEHVRLGGKMVDFAGWDMPIHYGSQVEEHHAVRRQAGMFDVSHMTVVDLTGDQTTEFLRYLLANDVARLSVAGKALYSCLLNERGGVIDDLIVYSMGGNWYRMVVNAATHDKDLDWVLGRAGAFAVEVTERPDLAMIAVQGPEARSLALAQMPPAVAQGAEGLKPFQAAAAEEWFVGRTGYTGEDGFELMLPAGQAPGFWRALVDDGVRPCGLGARDTLRLEAGMNLYGSDMDEDTSPLESGLAWTVAWDPSERDFIGRPALQAQREQGVERRLVGLVLEGKGVLRDHQKVVTDAGDGEITSGSFSPTLGRSIAFARVPAAAQGECQVDIRGRLVAARMVKPPFVRHGKAVVDL